MGVKPRDVIDELSVALGVGHEGISIGVRAERRGAQERERLALSLRDDQRVHLVSMLWGVVAIAVCSAP